MTAPPAAKNRRRRSAQAVCAVVATKHFCARRGIASPNWYTRTWAERHIQSFLLRGSVGRARAAGNSARRGAFGIETERRHQNLPLPFAGEQRKRFLARIDEPGKNWKFSLADIHERKYWKHYREAFEACLSATCSHHSPWYVVPACPLDCLPDFTGRAR